MQGRSPLAMLQQNKRDDARLFFKLESSLLFCANAQTADFVFVMKIIFENADTLRSATFSLQ
jgi:hypothetical protein